ncbi:hypothetical protein LTR49_025148 [Elasticomyces elasticus]|nr:hypothetical protein LTR49_025148 [Elasticomyces elasticus]
MAAIAPASVRLAGEPDDRSIDRIELISARRALRLLKGNLGPVGLHALVKKQKAAGNDVFRDHSIRSAGKEATGTITIEATNLTAADFSAWMMRAFACQGALIDAQPEHYLMDMTDQQGPHVVETLGDHVVGFYMGGWDESQIMDTDCDGVDRRRSTLRLDDDGTVVGHVSTTFRETEHEAIEQHLQHFSVEFRNWMLMAAAETQGKDV